jgi:hypothetical protein
VARELDLADVLMAKKLAEVEGMIKQFQQTSQSVALFDDSDRGCGGWSGAGRGV